MQTVLWRGKLNFDKARKNSGNNERFSCPISSDLTDNSLKTKFPPNFSYRFSLNLIDIFITQESKINNSNDIFRWWKLKKKNEKFNSSFAMEESSRLANQGTPRLNCTHPRIPVHGNRKTRRSKANILYRILDYLLDPLHTRKTLQECKGIALFPWKIYKSTTSFDPIHIYIYVSTAYNSTKWKKCYVCEIVELYIYTYITDSTKEVEWITIWKLSKGQSKTI